jgi:hypothetical protein
MQSKQEIKTTPNAIHFMQPLPNEPKITKAGQCSFVLRSFTESDPLSKALVGSDVLGVTSKV